MLFNIELPRLPRFKLFDKELPISEKNNVWWLALSGIFLVYYYYLNFKAVTEGVSALIGIEGLYVCIIILALNWQTRKFAKGTKVEGLINTTWNLIYLAGFHWAMHYSNWTMTLQNIYLAMFAIVLFMSFFLEVQTANGEFKRVSP